jgi:lipopolysaccharide transport system permease protein
MTLNSFSLHTLGQHRDLLWAWTSRTVRARYQQSLLGVLWAVLQPAAAVLIFAIVFTRIVPIETQGTPYVVFAFTAMVPWTFFTSSVTDMVASLVDNMNLVTKVYFPREILVIAALAARLVDFLVAGAVLVALMLVYRVPIFPLGWLFVPLILLIQIALALGLGLFGAALNVFYRDVKHLFTLGLQLWFYASPIIYPIDRVPPELRGLYFLNPMAGVLSAYRNVLLYGELPDATLWLAAAVAGVILLAGLWFFKRAELQFADVV